MADPSIETFCCYHRNQSDLAIKLMSQFRKDTYLYTCMVSSFIGILGSLYQIFIRSENDRQRASVTSSNASVIGRRVIVFLALADLGASLGVFTRSITWKYMKNFIPMSLDNNTFNIALCGSFGAITQFFYTATYGYTLSYAICVYQILKGHPPALMKHHAIIWSCSAVFTAVGLSVLYYPNADCHSTHDLITAIFRVLPVYLLTYLPILAVMIINPILFYLSSKLFTEKISLEFGQITNHERQLIKQFKLKFLFINLIFYLCWIPNLINGAILWFFWYTIPVQSILITWNLMAIFNPLQAMLNAIVYRKWRRFVLFEKCLFFFMKSNSELQLSPKSPLLRGEPRELQNYQAVNAGDGTLLEAPNGDHSVNSCPCV